ncbi:MAG TPA: DUF4349 domain-containing protein [Gemmatimonadales bacterium]|nr:DUF4349 domain-containing protein [Gemmatimonadales bacterium]
MKRAWLVAGVLSLAACRKTTGADAPLQSYNGSPVEEAPVSTGALPRDQATAKSMLYRQAANHSSAQRMITQSAEIRVIVRHPDSTSARLAAAALAAGGFVEDARQWRTNGQVVASITLRVPNDQLTPTLDAIRHTAIRVENESVSGEDVTAEYTDLGAQLTNLRATEAELRTLLVTVGQRTLKAADVLEVFNQLTDVRGQIEQTQARMGTLSKLASLATIKVSLVPDALSQPIATAGWRPLATVRTSFSDLLGTLRRVADGLIWVLVYLVPMVIAAAIPVGAAALGVRAVRRRWAVARIS